MNKPSFILILLVSILSFSLISVSGQIIDVTIDGNSSVYVCYPYEYNVTLRNTSSTLTASNINYTVSLPTGFSTMDPLTYNISSLGPGVTDKIKISLNTLCNAEVGNISVNGGYDYNNTSTTLSFTKPITVYQGAVTIEKTPSTQNATLEETVSWIISVKSTGFGPIEDVNITDILQPGLEYLSSSPLGVVKSPGTIEWSSSEIAALSHMDPNDEVQIQISAKVIGCTGLYDTARVKWGCGSGCETQETIASIAFQPNPPKIDYTVPSFNLTYCGTGNTFTIPITNTGGKAYDFNISADFGSLTVANITSPSGASYNPTGKYFILGDIPNGTTNLTFDLVPVSGWCSDSLPSGTVIFEPEYLYCDQEFLPPVKMGSYSVQGVPSLSVSKTGAPGSIYLGDSITYNIVASYSGPLTCGTGSASNILVVDTIPEGFSIVNNGGGTVVGNTITWNVDPATGLNTSITIQSPTYTQCQYCYTTITNTVNASMTDCCGCSKTESSSQSTILECSESMTSNKTISSNYNYEKCTPIEYTNTYNFPDDGFWDDVYIGNLKFREELANNQVLVSPVIITIDTCSVTYTPPSSTYLDVNFSDTNLQALISTSCGGLDATTTNVRNRRITVEYNLSNQNSSQPLCSSNYAFFDWSILDTGKDTSGNCYGSRQIREGVFVTVNGASMNVEITGLPTIIDRCGTYIVRLNINRDSVGGAYDVNVSFPTNNYHINSITFNGVTPIEIPGPAGYGWKYGDFFVNNNSASIDLNVTKTCDSNGQMNANVVWHDRCNNDVSGNICNDNTSSSPRLILSGNVCLMKVPELLWATTDKAQWKLCLTNAGSGASYNVWLEDVIGPGLSYNSSIGTYSQLYINQDRNGNPINGATWIIPKINAGDKTEIIFTANINSCTNLTNNASTSAGCLGFNCQDIKTDAASVRIPNSNAITTNEIPQSINMCDEQTATVKVKNTGLTYVYDVNVTATLPTGISYVTGSSPDPENTGVNPLRWTKAQIPALGAIAPSAEVTITFRIRSSCNMPSSGTFTSQASYLTPCNDSKISPQANSQITRVTPTLSIQKQGRNYTTGSSYANNVAAEPGDIVEWRIVITNSGNAPATNVEFYDALPSNMTFGGISTSPYPAVTIYPSPGTSGSPWIHGTLTNVSGSNTATYYVWGTVDSGECTNPINNIAYVRYGCDNGCRIPSPDYTASTGRALRTRPNFTLSQTIGTFTTCEGIITINIRNNSGYPTAYNVLLTSTLPPGFVFDSMITGPDPIPNPPSNPSQPVWSLGNMLASSTNTVLQFRVKNDDSSCGTVTPGNNIIKVDYQDRCGNNLVLNSTSSSVTPLKPNLIIEKSPEVQVVAINGQANWTITLRNTGNTNANNVTVTDILDTNWNPSTIVAGTGSNGEVPLIVDNTVTWKVSNPIPGPSGIWTATISANLIDAAGTGRNDVYARGGCPSGCAYSSATDSATILNLEGIAKTSRKQTATIGEEVIFDIAVNYHGVGSVYTNTSILDTMPGGLEYISHTFNETNSSIPHPYTQAGQSINWMLGTPSGLPNRTFTGPNSVQIALTTKIRDTSGNINGVTLINPVNTTFIQDGNPGDFSDNDDVQIVEPNLTIAKDINGTDSMQALPGQSIHYRIVVTNNGTSPAFEVYIRDQVPNGLILDIGSIQSTPNSNGVSISGNDIEWYYNTIVNGDSVTLEYDAVVPPRGGLFVNNANVPQNGYSSMPGDVTSERFYGPLSDDTQLTTPGTDLTKLTLNTDANIPSPGGIVYYSLTIENSGALPLNPVQLIDILPDGLTYITGTADINGTFSDPTIVQNPNGTETLTWANLNSIIGQPEMPVEQFILVKFQARVDPGRIGTFINEATVIGTVVGLGDVTDKDDSPVGVKEPAINIVKSVDPPYGKVGFENKFTLKVTNTGELPLNPVYVKDTLPKGLVYAGGANIAPDSVIVNSDGTTTILWNNIGALEVGESRPVIFSAKFNGLENKSINYVLTEGQPPNGDPVTDDDQVEILKKSGSNPRETLRIITGSYMKRCDLCNNEDLLQEARKLITTQNIVDEEDTCCRPENIIEDLKFEILKKGLDKDPRYIKALKLLDDADQLCEEAQTNYDKGNYGQAQRLTKDKCEAITEAIKLLMEILSEKK